MKIIIRNRRKYDEKQELRLDKFKMKFKNELACAIHFYSNQQMQKDMLMPPFMTMNTDYHADFYNDLRWNFNNFVQSEWYIDRIQ